MAIIPSNDYVGRIDDTDPNMPQGKAINLIGAVVGTGTPLEASWVNDTWGMQQAILLEAGITPSGAADNANNSQYLEGIKTVVNINDLSQTYNFDTVADYKAFTTEFPVGKKIHLADRCADFTVIAGTGTANTWDIIASTEVSQSISMTLGEAMTTTQFGLLHNGTEETAAIQNALDKMSGVGSLVNMVGQTGQTGIDPVANVNIPSNTTLYFAYGSSWKAINPTDATSYIIMDIRDVQNVSVWNPVLIGDKDEHVGATGEQGHCLNFSETLLGNTSNINIHNPICTKAWGDGIVLRKGKVINIYNATCQDNRRNAVTINKGVDVYFHGDTRLSDTDGIAPEAGLDIEPNDNSGELTNIIFDNLITRNNTGPGMTLNTGDFPSGGVDKDFSITIHRHEDTGSVYGLNVEKMAGSLTEKIGGSVTFGEQIYKSNGSCGVYFNDYTGSNSPVIHMPNLTIVDPNELGSASFLFGAGIGIDRKAGSGLTNTVGNCIITHPVIKDTRAVTKMTRGIAGADNDASGATLENFKIIDPVEISGYASDGDAVHVSWLGMELSDKYEQVARQLSGSLSVTSRAYSRLFSVSAALYTVTDGTTKDNAGMPLIVEALGSGTGGIRFTPKAGRSVFPLSTVAGKYIQSTDRGARITMKLNTSEDTWYIIEQIGNWTVEP